MKHLLTIFAVLLLFAGCTPKTKEAITIPEGAEKSIAAIHIVGKEESIYKIASEYGVTREALIEMNPILNTQKLKKGMKLYIPKVQKEVIEVKKDTVAKEEKPVVVEKKSIKAAVVLPFMLDKYAPTEQERMVEFYQGFLMAVETLKNEGHSFEINTYDAGESTQSLDTLISSGKLNDCDIIFGALYPNHNKQLATFAKQHDIPLVLPFAVKEDDVYANPKAYITNALQTYIVERGIEKFAERYCNANIIFVKNEFEVEEKEFATKLLGTLQQKNISHTTIVMDSLISMANSSGSTYIASCMKPDTMNIFIPTSSKVETFNTVLPTLLVLKRDTVASIPEFMLFGYPEWQIYAANSLEAMYEVDTYFYTSFFANSILPEAVDIQARYAGWYNRSMQNRFPRYGMLGYDVGCYFLKAMSLYGKKMPENINNVEFTPTQSGFNFTRKNNRGAYINNKVFLVRYSPEYKVEKIDLDK